VAKGTTKAAAEAKEIPDAKSNATEAPVEPEASDGAALDPEIAEEIANDAPLDFQKDVLPRVFKLTEAHGRDAVVAVLSEFGVPKASQVPPEKFAEFVAAVNKAIG